MQKYANLTTLLLIVSDSRLDFLRLYVWKENTGRE